MTDRVRTTVELPSAREILLTRWFGSPPAVVFEMWTDAGHVPRWYGRPAFVVSDCRIDLRVGGSWSWVQRDLGGEEIAVSGVYQEIDRPSRLVFTEELDVVPGGAHLVAMDFAACAGGTLLSTRILHRTQTGRDEHLRRGMRVRIAG